METLQTAKDIAKYVNRTYESDTVRSFLFGFESMQKSQADKYYVIHSLLMLTYSCIYAKWMKFGRRCATYARNPHADKVFQVLGTVYKAQPLDLDVVLYTLTEGRRDVIECGENSFFYEFFAAEGVCKYSKLYDLLSISVEKAEGMEGQEQKVMEYMPLLVQDLKILHTLDAKIGAPVSQTSDKCTVTLCFGGEEYPTHDFLTYSNVTEEVNIMTKRHVMNDYVKRNYLSILQLTVSTNLDVLANEGRG